MQTFKISKAYQYLLAITAVAISSIICYLLSAVIGYKVVAYVLLITVSLLAMLLDIFPVLLAASLSALIWDFFFIPPHFTFQVSSAEDALLLLMYFLIALVNAALTYKIRRMEKAAILEEEKENTVKLYNTLLNSLSHELKTPIATIIAATDNLQTNKAKLTPSYEYELITEISKASLRLNRQVENLLNMSRIEAGVIKPRKDWCDVEEIIYDTVKRIEESNIAQKIHINVHPGIPLYKLDGGMLEQVIYNILYNATLYTPSNSEINILVMSHADVLEIIIEDNGKGFPQDEITEVFNKFYRLKNTKAGGTGLGLSIVKGFVEALDGVIELKNISTGGARFTISIKSETSYLKNLKNE